MADAARQFVLRMSTEGVDGFVGNLRKAAETSDQARNALDQLTRAAPSLATGMERAQQSLAASATSFRAANENATAAGGGFRSMSGNLGQLGYQIQDFSVQVQGGTSALVALSQQGSQALGIFGPAGAAAGAGLTVGILAVQLLGLVSAGDALKAALEGQKTLWEQSTDAAERYRKGLADQGADLEKLAAYYATLTESVRVYEERRLQAAQSAIAEQRAAQSREIISPASGVLQESGDRPRPVFTPAGDFAGYEIAVTALTDRMRTLVEVVRAFEATGAPTTQSLAELENRLMGLAVGSDAAAQAARNIIDRIREKDGEVRKLSQAEEQLTGQLSALRGGLDDTGGAAAGTARNVSELVAQVLNLKQASAETTLGPLRENLANLDAQVEAARRGTAALAQVRREQQAQAQADQALERAVKAEGDRLTKTLSPEEAAPKLEEFRNETRQIVDAARERTLQVAKLEEEARARETAARTASRSAATAARREERQEVRDEAKAKRDAERENADALRDRQKLVQENETSYERYQRRLEEVAVLQERADKAGSPIDAETIRRQTDEYIRELERAGEHANDMRAKDAERIEQEQSRALERQEQQFDRVVDRYSADLSRGVVDALFEGTKQGESFFETLANTFKGMLRNAVTAALDAMVIRPLLGSLLGGLGLGPEGALGLAGAAGLSGGGSGGGGGIMGMGRTGLAGAGLMTRLFGPSSLPGGGYNISSVGNAFTGGQVATGFGGFDSAANATAYNGLGGAPVSYAGATAGALGIAGGGYGIYSGVKKGGVGGGFQAAGGAVSAGLGAAAMAGLAVPIYGWIAAAVLTIIGALLPGQKPSNKEGTGILNLADDTIRITGQTGSKFSQENRDQAAGVVSGLKGIINQAEGLLGFNATQTVEVGVGSRDGVEFRYQGEERGYKRTEEDLKLMTRDIVQRVVTDNAGAMAEAVRNALGGVNWGDLEGALRQLTQLGQATNNGRTSANQDIASRNIDWSNFEQGIADLTWVRDVYDQLGKSAEATSEWARQMAELRQQYDAMGATAARLGLATDEVVKAWQAAIDDLVRQREIALSAMDLDVSIRSARARGDVQTADALAYNAQANQELADARKKLADLGLTAEQVAQRLAQLEQVQGLERAEIARRHMQAVTEIERAAVQAAEAAAQAAAEAARQAAANAKQLNFEERDLQARAARAGGNDYTADMLSFYANADREAEQAVEQWQQMGLNLEQVRTRLRWLQEVQNAERLSLERRYQQQSLEQQKRAQDEKIAEQKRGEAAAKNLLEQLAIGEAGGLRPETRYFAGLQSLNSARQALGEDGATADEIQEFARVAQMILPVARDFLGTSERYGSLVSDITATLKQYAPGGDIANLSSLIEAQTMGTDRTTEAILSTAGVTNDILGKIQTDISRLNASLSAVMARMAA